MPRYPKCNKTGHALEERPAKDKGCYGCGSFDHLLPRCPDKDKKPAASMKGMTTSGKDDEEGDPFDMAEFEENYMFALSDRALAS